MMNKYESVIILNPTLNEEKIKKITEDFEKLINDNGKVEKTEIIGKKKLAYEIQKHKEGFYIIFIFESEAYFINELERQYRINENVMKFIVVKVSD